MTTRSLGRLTALLFAAAGSVATASETVDLTPWADLGSGPVAVEASLRFVGAVTAEGAAEARPVHGEMTLAYTQEELADDASGSLRVLRRIDRLTGAKLRPETQLLVAEIADRGAKVVAVAGPLTRSELDAVQLAADPLDIDGVLPGGEVRDGGTWKVDPAAVGRLMRLTPGDLCEVVGVVSDITPTHARLRLAGTIEGAADGAKVQIDLRGVALFDRQLGRLTRVNLAWKETRAVGPATPAVEATAKLNVALRPVDESSHLGAEAAAKASAATLDERLIVSVAGGAWTLLAERDWFVVADDRHATTLRRIEGDRIAAVTTLTGDSQRSLSLPDFEREVRNTLGKDLAQVVTTQVTPDDHGLTRLTIASLGKVEDQPVEWRHHHVANADAAISATTTLRVDEGSADDAPVRRLIESVRPHSAQSETAAAEAAAVRR